MSFLAKLKARFARKAKAEHSRRLAEGVSRPPWSWRAAACAVLIALAGIKLLPGGYVWSDVVAHLPMLGCVAFLTWRAGTGIGRAFGLARARVGRVLASGLLLFLCESLLQSAVTLLLLWLGLGGAHTEETRREARATLASPFLFADASLLAPFCEELTCRGLLYTSLRTRFNVAASVLGTAAVFALIHPYSFAESCPLFFAALISSLWYERTRSLWPNIIAHALNNTMTTFVMGSG
jgi:membrane protease YdiL (CAAX protease family)